LKRTDEIDEILSQFPFYRRNRERQVRVLSRYVVESLGLSQVDTARELGVSRETVKQIRDVWSQLSVEDRLVLIRFLQEQYIKSSSKLDECEILESC
jgi:DNA-binding NarL/FixJ family response regulator